MKTKVNLIVILMCAVLGLASCSDEKMRAPTVVLNEVGHDNSRVAMAGDDLHVEANIVAENIIASVSVSLLCNDADYSISKEWNDGKYVGVKNALFHEHIDIPDEAYTGRYTLRFSVSDKSGKRTEVVDNIDIVKNN